MKSLVVILTVIFTSAVAFGFDIVPEFQGLSESELARMERPADLDAEYQSVIDSYLPRFDWEKKWSRTPRVFETTVGSITNQHFLVYSRAKIQVELEETLHFRFTYFEQRDREIDQTRHFVELIKRVSPWLAISGYGEPSHYKRSNDIGVALIVSPNEHWENRVYYTQHDFTRSAHNDLADRFIGDDPMSIGWTSVFDDRTTFSRVGFRHDRPVAWNLPQEGRLFRYEKTLMFTDFSVALDEKRDIGLRIQFDSTFKGQNPVGVSTQVLESWKRDRLLSRLFYSIGADDDELKLEYSIGSASRGWTNETGRHVMHQNVLPAVSARFGSYRADIEVTDFKKFGDDSLTAIDQKRETVQGRSQLAYEFSFKNGADLLIAGNFDLDEWITLPTFEGGNAQLRTEF
ncbi:MAG: hypothetical protein AAB250_17985 [Bdellovibrionota bacterium]